MKFKFKFVAFSMILVLFLGIIATFVLYYLTGNILLDRSKAQLETTVNYRANYINYFLSEQKNKIEIFGIDNIFEEYLKNSSNVSLEEDLYLKIDKRLNDSIDGVFVKASLIDKNNIIIASTDKKYLYQNFSERISPYKEFFVEDTFFMLHYFQSTGEYYFGISSPIFDSKTGEYLGLLSVHISLEDFYDIISDSEGFGETGEIYVVDYDGYVVAPLEIYGGERIKIFTEGFKQCIEDYGEYGASGEVEKHEEDLLIFNNYFGKEVLGVHGYIPEFRWCIFGEMEKEEILSGLKDRLVRLFLIVLPISFIIIIFGSFFLESVPYSKKRSGFVKYLSKIKLKKYFIFGLVFAILYFLVITAVFNGINNALFFDDVPDLLIFLICFLIFGYSFRVKLIGQKLLSFGSFFICIEKLLEIVVQEYESFIGVLIIPLAWIALEIIGFTGLMFMMISAWRLSK